MMKQRRGPGDSIYEFVNNARVVRLLSSRMSGDIYDQIAFDSYCDEKQRQYQIHRCWRASRHEGKN